MTDPNAPKPKPKPESAPTPTLTPKVSRLYRASLEIEFLVVAGSEREAQRLAAVHIDDEIQSMSYYDTSVSRATYLPEAWTETDEPYGDNEGLTAGEWLAKEKALRAEERAGAIKAAVDAFAEEGPET